MVIYVQFRAKSKKNKKEKPGKKEKEKKKIKSKKQEKGKVDKEKEKGKEKDKKKEKKNEPPKQQQGDFLRSFIILFSSVWKLWWNAKHEFIISLFNRLLF